MASACILLVEDDQNIRDCLKEILEGEGYFVSAAANGRKALDVLSSAPLSFSLILLDLMMPVLNGWQFLEQLEKNHPEKFHSIPVVVLSAASDLMGKAIGLGVKEFVRKPLEIDDLLAVVGRHAPARFV